MISFAKTYDPVPLHYDEEYAAKSRFGRMIAPGVMTFMSVWAKFVELNIFGDELIAGKSTRIEWFKPVFAGDVLRGKVVVTGLRERSARNGEVELTLYAYNQKGQLVLTDVTEVIIRRQKV